MMGIFLFLLLCKIGCKISEILEYISDKYKPTYPSVIKLSDNHARIIKDSFRMAKKHDDYKTLIKLRVKIIEVMGMQSRENSDQEFIARF
jgi:hypothetical protein